MRDKIIELIVKKVNNMTDSQLDETLYCVQGIMRGHRFAGRER